MTHLTLYTVAVKRTLLVLASALAPLFSGLGDAIPLLESFNAPIVGSWGGTDGWSFLVGPNPITLNALGAFDYMDDGFYISHQVGIWDSGGTLLASVVVKSGTGSTLYQGFRYEPIANLALSANAKYYLGWTGGGGDGSTGYSGTQTVNPAITFVWSQWANEAFAWPQYDGSDPGKYFGPNALMAQQGSVPDSSATAGLLLVSVGAMAVIRRRLH